MSRISCVALVLVIALSAIADEQKSATDAADAARGEYLILDANHLDTLALAYAASENYTEAIAWLKRAIVVAPEHSRAAMQNRLEFYAGKQQTSVKE